MKRTVSYAFNGVRDHEFRYAVRNGIGISELTRKRIGIGGQSSDPADGKSYDRFRYDYDSFYLALDDGDEVSVYLPLKVTGRISLEVTQGDFLNFRGFLRFVWRCPDCVIFLFYFLAAIGRR